MKTLALYLAVAVMSSGCFAAGGSYLGYKSAIRSNAARDEQIKRGEQVDPPMSPSSSMMAAGTVGLMIDAALAALLIKSRLDEPEHL